MSIKSLTPPKNILSMRFPAVPAINNTVMIRFVFFVKNSRINAPIPAKLITKTRMSGTGNDREIPLLNAALNRGNVSRYLIS